MKHLYSTFAALLLILLTSIAGFAQRNNAKPKSVITRTIVGCTLGETTLEQIKENVQAQGGEIENFSDVTDGPRMKTIVVSGLRFWGETRDKIMMKTVDSILYTVIILIPDKSEADRLKNSLILKYRGWEDNMDTPSKPFRWLQRNGFTIKYDTTCYPYDVPATSSSTSRKAGRPCKSATEVAVAISPVYM